MRRIPADTDPYQTTPMQRLKIMWDIRNGVQPGPATIEGDTDASRKEIAYAIGHAWARYKFTEDE